MKACKCTVEDLKKALELTNKKYDGNIRFKRLDFPIFTLTVNSTADGKKGYRISASNTQRKVSAACWHVHGDFFDNLFSINPKAYARVSTPTGERSITKDSGNWEDRNIGSYYYPMLFSKACNCE